MNSAERSVDMQSTWDAVDNVDVWIEDAAFAVLEVTLGQRCVTLIHEEKAFCVKGKSLTYEGGGLHYDGDTATSRDRLQATVVSGEREITRRWARCEQFLADAECDADREQGEALASRRRWLGKDRAAVKLSGLRMTRHGLLIAASWIPRKERRKLGRGLRWGPKLTLEGEEWGVIEFLFDPEKYG